MTTMDVEGESLLASSNAARESAELDDLDFVDDAEEGHQEKLRHTTRSVLDHPLTKSVLSLAYHLVPTFLRPSNFVSSRQDSQHTKLRPTACLDGLRGLAAYSVTWYHYVGAFYSEELNFGWTPDHTSFFQLPVIKAFYNGIAMVSVFFVISGYVLSYKMLKLSRKSDWEESMNVLASSVFRRAMRLYIPAIAVLFCVTLLTWIGAFEPARAQLPGLLDLELSRFPFQLEGFWAYMGHLWQTVWRLANPWTWDMYFPQQEGALWTILQEFRASMVLFIIAAGLVKVRNPLLRQGLLFGLMVWCAFCVRWDVVLFLAGMLLADFDLDHPPQRSTNASSSQAGLDTQGHRDVEKDDDRLMSPTMQNIVIGLPLTTVALFFLSTPMFDAEHAWGYYYLTHLSSYIYGWDDAWRFGHGIGATLFVIAAIRFNILTSVLETRLVQWLGKVSLSFYMLHGPIMRIVAFWAVPKLWGWTGRGPVGYPLAVGMFYPVWILLVMCVSDVFRRLVDAPSIKFARWVESKCFQS